MNSELNSRAALQLALDASDKAPGAVGNSRASVNARHSNVKSNQQETSRFSSHLRHEIERRDSDHAPARSSQTHKMEQAEDPGQHKHRCANAPNTPETRNKNAAAHKAVESEHDDDERSQNSSSGDKQLSNDKAASASADTSNPVDEIKVASVNANNNFLADAHGDGDGDDDDGAAAAPHLLMPLTATIASQPTSDASAATTSNGVATAVKPALAPTVSQALSDKPTAQQTVAATDASAAAELNHASLLKDAASNGDKESSKRLFLENINQLQLNQAKLRQAASAGQNGQQPSPERQLAENYYHAMIAAGRAQNLASASLVEDGSSTYRPGAKALASASANLSSTSIVDAAGPSAMNPIKTDSLSDASVPGAKLNAPMHERLGQAQWQQDLSQRINIMLNHQIREARIQLHPKHLGSLEISVSMGHEQQVNVSFQVQHAHVKDALDAALPKLREMLQSQGFSLDHSDVSQQQDSSGHGNQTLRSPRSIYSPSYEQEQQDAQALHTISISADPSAGLDLFV